MCSSGRLENIVRFLLEFVIEVRVAAWGLLWIDQFESVCWVTLLHLLWVESYSLRVLKGCRPLVGIQQDLLFHLLFHLLAHFLTMFHTHLNDLKSVPDEFTFDSLVDGSIGPEGRRVIHFQHPRFELCVKHDIEAE